MLNPFPALCVCTARHKMTKSNVIPAVKMLITDSNLKCFPVVVRQLADKDCIATCEASSVLPSGDDYICDNAIDGSLRSGRGYEWASNGEGEGAWIQINFGYYYQIIDFMLLQRCDVADKIKTFRLGFSAGPELEV